MKSVRRLFQDRKRFKFQLEVIRALNLQSHLRKVAASVKFSRNRKQFVTDCALVDEFGQAAWNQKFAIGVTLFRSKSTKIYEFKKFRIDIEPQTKGGAAESVSCSIDFSHYVTLKDGQNIVQALPLHGAKKGRSGPSSAPSEKSASASRPAIELSKSSAFSPEALSGPTLLLRVTRIPDHEVGTSGAVIDIEPTETQLRNPGASFSVLALDTGKPAVVEVPKVAAVAEVDEPEDDEEEEAEKKKGPERDSYAVVDEKKGDGEGDRGVKRLSSTLDASTAAAAVAGAFLDVRISRALSDSASGADLPALPGLNSPTAHKAADYITSRILDQELLAISAADKAEDPDRHSRDGFEIVERDQKRLRVSEGSF